MYPVDVSPDGRFVSYIARGRTRRLALVVLDLTTNRRRVLATGDADWSDGGDFSRDGRFLSFRRGRTLLAVDLSGREYRLADGARFEPPRWIAGDRLVFVGSRGGLLAATIDGRVRRLWRSHFRAYTSPAISPAGDLVVYTAGCRLRLRELATGRDRVVARTGWAPLSWSPDGRYFVAESAPCNNGRPSPGYPASGLDLYTRSGRRLGSAWGSGATWSTDSRYLLTWGGVTGSGVGLVQPLGVVTLATLRQATLIRAGACGPAVTGPGGWTLYCRYEGHGVGSLVSGEPEFPPARLYVARLAVP